MTPTQTKEYLDELLQGKDSILTLVGGRFHGTFGRYEVAAMILKVVKEGDSITFNYVGEETSHVYYNVNIGVVLHRTDRGIGSENFHIDLP